MADISKIQLEGSDYNIKDATARTNISSLNTRVSNLETEKHLVIIGDSFSTTTYNPEASAWYTIVGRKLGLTVHNFAKNGAGYVRQGQGNRNFSIEVDDAIADTSFSNNDVSMVIVYGGLNDMDDSYASNIAPYSANLCDKINTNFPNAKVIIMGINAWANTFTKVNNENQLYYFLQIRKACCSKAVSFINTCLWLRSYGNTNSLYDNTTGHPNETGNSVIASCLLTALCGQTVIPNPNDIQIASYSASVGSGTMYVSANSNYLFVRGAITTDSTGKGEWDDVRKIFSNYTSLAGLTGASVSVKFGLFNYNASTEKIQFNAGSAGASDTFYFRFCVPLV